MPDAQNRCIGSFVSTHTSVQPLDRCTQVHCPHPDSHADAWLPEARLTSKSDAIRFKRLLVDVGFTSPKQRSARVRRCLSSLRWGRQCTRNDPEDSASGHLPVALVHDESCV